MNKSRGGVDDEEVREGKGGEVVEGASPEKEHHCLSSLLC